VAALLISMAKTVLAVAGTARTRGDGGMGGSGAMIIMPHNTTQSGVRTSKSGSGSGS